MKDALYKLHNALLAHPDITIIANEPMSRHTSVKIGGAAELFCELSSVEAVCVALNCARELDIEPFIMGNGTNLLVDDSGIPGAVFKINGGKCEVSGDCICVDAGVSIATLARKAKDNSLSGLECAYGIPGTVGGAVVMNAGAYGFEIKDVLVESTYLDENGIVKTLGTDEHNFGYRTSFFKEHPKCIVLSAKIKLIRGNKEEIEGKMNDILARRREKQPLEFPSAGSVFKRPEGYFTGALIEQSGLKGYSIGGAQVSEKHAGFIINKDNATGKDVKELIEYIKETVFENYGVELEREVLYAPSRK